MADAASYHVFMSTGEHCAKNGIYFEKKWMNWTKEIGAIIIIHILFEKNSTQIKNNIKFGGKI